MKCSSCNREVVGLESIIAKYYYCFSCIKEERDFPRNAFVPFSQDEVNKYGFFEALKVANQLWAIQVAYFFDVFQLRLNAEDEFRSLMKCGYNEALAVDCVKQKYYGVELMQGLQDYFIQQEELIKTIYGLLNKFKDNNLESIYNNTFDLAKQDVSNGFKKLLNTNKSIDNVLNNRGTICNLLIEHNIKYYRLFDVLHHRFEKNAHNKKIVNVMFAVTGYLCGTTIGCLSQAVDNYECADDNNDTAKSENHYEEVIDDWEIPF